MIQINYRDARPIYEQVKDGIRKLAYAGVLSPDEKLPSVRELASKLAINPNTISKAYKELEQEGFLYTQSGVGTFINQDFDMESKKKEELINSFEKLVKEMLEYSIIAEEMNQMINELSRGKQQEENSNTSIEGGAQND